MGVSGHQSKHGKLLLNVLNLYPFMSSVIIYTLYVSCHYQKRTTRVLYKYSYKKYEHYQTNNRDLQPNLCIQQRLVILYVVLINCQNITGSWLLYKTIYCSIFSYSFKKLNQSSFKALGEAEDF